MAKSRTRVMFQKPVDVSIALSGQVVETQYGYMAILKNGRTIEASCLRNLRNQMTAELCVLMDEVFDAIKMGEHQ